MAMLQTLALAALRAALQFGSAKDMERAIGWWASVKGGLFDDEIAGICADLMDRHLAHAAVSLASAEVARAERAKSLYLHARCLEAAARDDEALVAFRRARERAQREGDAAIVRASQVHTVRLLARDDLTFEQAIGEAAAIEREALEPEAALFVAQVLLASTSRFIRASALASLTEIARRSPSRRPWKQRAIELGLRHASARGDTLSAVEAERLAALLAITEDAANPRLEAQRLRARELESTGAIGRALVDAARAAAREGHRETAISYLREARARFGPR